MVLFRSNIEEEKLGSKHWTKHSMLPGNSHILCDEGIVDLTDTKDYLPNSLEALTRDVLVLGCHGSRKLSEYATATVITPNPEIGTYAELARELAEIRHDLTEVRRLVELEQQALDKLSGSGDPPEVGSIIVPVTTLEPAPFVLLREIPCVIQPEDGGYLATFFDANISSAGETQQEAFENLKSLLVDVYNDLESEEPQKLGPEPKRQLQILRAILRRRVD